VVVGIVFPKKLESLHRGRSDGLGHGKRFPRPNRPRIIDELPMPAFEGQQAEELPLVVLLAAPML
jgi:hypothetical protein